MAASVEMTEEDRSRFEKLHQWFTEAAEPEHKLYEDAWDHQDVLYHGHKRLVSASASASPRDKDSIVMEARKEFGAELHIPYTFSTVETIMPRTLSNRPRMLWTPRDRVAENNVENVRVICDAQQHRADYELKLQTTIRSGMKHGLGVQKVFWRLEERDSFVLCESSTGEWTRKPVTKKAWDDPDVHDVDIRDFYWDPFGDSMQTVRRVLHRSWRHTEYVVQKLASGAWGRYPLTPEDVESISGADKHAAAWAGRRRAQGLTAGAAGSQRNESDIHEVWEIHDAFSGEVVTILDRLWIVQVIANPYWHGELPFHIFRPIEVEHRMVGVGVIDPIEDLQKELDWLRTDRRWNAMLKLHQAYAYNDGTVDPAQVKIGPGRLVPVNGDPRDLLVPLQVGDIPNSGYQEEAALLHDIEVATGVSDTVSGGDSGGQTATGVQLVQAAAGLRIQAYTHRAELELIKPEARQWLALNQQRWVQERDVPFPATPEPGQPDRRWSWRKVGPNQMAGEFDVEPDGGATAPDNVPQKRQDMTFMLQLLMQAQGMIDPQRAIEWMLEKLDVSAPQSFIAHPSSVPAETLDYLQQMLVEQAGLDPAGAHGLIANALNAAMDAQQQQAGDAARAGGQAGGGQPGGGDVVEGSAQEVPQAA